MWNESSTPSTPGLNLRRAVFSDVFRRIFQSFFFSRSVRFLSRVNVSQVGERSENEVLTFCLPYELWLILHDLSSNTIQNFPFLRAVDLNFARARSEAVALADLKSFLWISMQHAQDRRIARDIGVCFTRGSAQAEPGAR